MTESSSTSLASLLNRSFRDGTLPAYRNAKAQHWVLACDELLRDGRFDCFTYSVRHLNEAFPGTRALKTLLSVIDHAPDGPLLPFKDDPLADVQITARPGCDTVLIAFCGNASRLGISLDLAHLWLGRLPVNLIYLRDRQRLAGAAGFPSFGPHREAAVEALKSKIAGLGATHILTYGTSAGGFPALYYGLTLGAQCVLALSPTTNLSREFQARIGPVPLWSETVRTEVPDYGPDLRIMYERALQPPIALLAYGEDNSRDAAQSQNMAGLASTELIPISGVADHNVVVPTIASGGFPRLLDRLLATLPTDRHRGGAHQDEQVNEPPPKPLV